jgi:[protein]-arginine 3-hydroxylase / protease
VSEGTRAVWPLSADQFQSLVAAQRPVLFHGAAEDWPCTRRWTNAYLLERIGDRTITVTRSKTPLFRVDPERGHYAPEEMESMLFSDFLTRICASSTDGPCYYLHKHSVNSHLPELLSDVVVPEQIKDAPMLLTSLWMGPRGSITPIHHDFSDNFFVQARGRKRVVLYPPTPDRAFYRLPFRAHNGRSSWHISRVGSLDHVDRSTFPLFEEAKPQEFIVGPGDLLYIPTFWWHEVHSLDSPSMSLSYWWSSKTVAEIDGMIAQITAFMELYGQAPAEWRALIRRVVGERIAACPDEPC